MLPMVPYLAFLALLHVVGIPLAGDVVLTFACIFLLAGWSMFALLGVWFQQPGLRLAGAMAYMAAPYVMIEWQAGEAIEFIAYGAAPLVVLIVWRLMTELRVSVALWLGLAGIAFLLAAPSSNPPSVIAQVLLPALICVVAAWRSSPVSPKRRFQRLTGGVVIAVGINLWWVIPTGVALGGGYLLQGFGSSYESQNPPDLTTPVSFFSHITGFGYWAWNQGYAGHPYYAFSAHYQAWGMVILTSIPIAVMAFGLARYGTMGPSFRTLIRFGFGLWIVGFFLSYGFKGPTGPLYTWAYRHVPGFVAFRSPWEKFSPVQILGETLLWTVGIAVIGAWVRRILETRTKGIPRWYVEAIRGAAA